MSRFDRLYSKFKATQTDKLSHLSTTADDNRDNFITDRNISENLIYDQLQTEDRDISDTLESSGTLPAACDSEKSKEVSQMSHARANKERGSQLFSKDNQLSNNSIACASDNRDTYKTNTIIPPNNCENCSASGKWDWKSPGLLCFHSAFFLAKPAKPIPCLQASKNCPLKKDPSPA